MRRKRPPADHRWRPATSTRLLGTQLDTSYPYSVLPGSPAPPPRQPSPRASRARRHRSAATQPPPTALQDPVAQVELFVDPTVHRLTPLSVQTVRFRRTRRGYDMRQVDDYLDEVAAEMARLHLRLQDHGDSAAQPTPAGPAGKETEPPPLARVRVLAIRVASEIVADAMVQAARIYERAHQQAQEVLADAQHDAAHAAADRHAQMTGPSREASSVAGAVEKEDDCAVQALAARPRDDAVGMVLHGPWTAGRQR